MKDGITSYSRVNEGKENEISERIRFILLFLKCVSRFCVANRKQFEKQLAEVWPNGPAMWAHDFCKSAFPSVGWLVRQWVTHVFLNVTK